MWSRCGPPRPTLQPYRKRSFGDGGPHRARPRKTAKRNTAAKRPRPAQSGHKANAIPPARDSPGRGLSRQSVFDVDGSERVEQSRQMPAYIHKQRQQARQRLPQQPEAEGVTTGAGFRLRTGQAGLRLVKLIIAPPLRASVTTDERTSGPAADRQVSLEYRRRPSSCQVIVGRKTARKLIALPFGLCYSCVISAFVPVPADLPAHVITRRLRPQPPGPSHTEPSCQPQWFSATHPACWRKDGPHGCVVGHDWALSSRFSALSVGIRQPFIWLLRHCWRAL